MRAQGSPDAAREGGSTEWLLRACAVLAYGVAVSNLARAWWIDPSRLTILMLLLTEAYTLGLLLFARRATLRGECFKAASVE